MKLFYFGHLGLSGHPDGGGREYIKALRVSHVATWKRGVRCGKAGRGTPSHRGMGLWMGLGRGVCPLRRKKNDFLLKMACFNAFWAALFVRVLARKMLNFPPEVVILVDVEDALLGNALATEPLRRFRYFEATEPSISFFLLFYAHKRPIYSPFFLYISHKKPSFRDKWSISSRSRILSWV